MHPPAQFFDQVEQESREQLETLLTPEDQPGTVPCSYLGSAWRHRKSWTTCAAAGTSI